MHRKTINMVETSFKIFESYYNYLKVTHMIIFWLSEKLYTENCIKMNLKR